MRRIAIPGLVILAATIGLPARADDLTGATKLLCSAGAVSTCCDDGQCATGTAAELGVPQFLEIDLAAKKVSTTAASGLNRSSIADVVKRDGGKIFVQGIDNGRAYSYVIREKAGDISVAVAGGECSVMAYGACTPIPAAK